jgi:hypothetical protein
MSFEKVRFGKGEIFTTIVEDSNGKILAKWKVMKKDFPQVVRILSGQFGMKMKVLNKDEDLSWAIN